MMEFYPSETIDSANERSLHRLHRSITLSQGQFSLIFACCNSTSFREKMLNYLPENVSNHIQKLVLHPYVSTLYTTIQETLEGNTPPALMVFGLDSVVELEKLLASTNFVRDNFRQDFPFPVVLWVNDEVMQKIIRLAPDFKNWAGSTIRFHIASEYGSTPQLACQLA